MEWCVQRSLVLVVYFWCCANVCWRVVALPTLCMFAYHFGPAAFRALVVTYRDPARIQWTPHLAVLGVPLALSQIAVALHRHSLYTVAPMEFARMLLRPSLYGAVVIGSVVWCIPLVRYRGPVQRVLFPVCLYLHVILYLRVSNPPVCQLLL
jgi:hypothetical protein